MKALTMLFFFCTCLFFVSCHQKKARSKEKSSIESYSQDTSRINATNFHAIEMIRKRDVDSALVILNRNLQKSIALNYTYGMGIGYWYSGLAQFYRYQYDAALQLHQKAYEIFESAGDKKMMGSVLFSMEYDYSLKNDMQKSLECGEKAMKLFEEIGDYVSAYDCLEGIIYVQRQLHHTEIVDSLMTLLVSTAEKTADKKKIANSYFNLGSYYLDQAYLNLAIEAFYKALKIGEESGDSIEIANALGSIGLANLHMKDYKNAIEYYLRQEKIIKNKVNQYELSVTYSNLGESYNALGDYKKGLSYHLKSLEMRKDMNFRLAISNSLQNIGYTYLIMKDSASKALTFIKQSLSIDLEMKNYDGVAKNYMLLGKIYAINRGDSLGIRYLEKSIELARKYNNPFIIKEASETLVDLYAGNMDYEKAFTNMIINKQVSDSLSGGDNIKRITQLEMQHAFEKQQNETEVSHLKEMIRYENTIKRNRLILTYSTLFGLMVIVFVAFLYRSYIKSRKADKEKEALLKEIHHRVKNNLMVISSLLNLQSGTMTDDSTRAAVKESQSRVKSMALIHQLLYQSEMFTSIDFPKYLDQLMASLQSAYSKPGKNIQYKIRADDIKLDIDTAIPLGLITNELATNAYKYAFTDSTNGLIEVDFVRTDNHKYLLRICDNGKGLPAGLNLEDSPTLGLKLVKILTKQIKAKLHMNTNKGTEFTVVFADGL